MSPELLLMLQRSLMRCGIVLAVRLSNVGISFEHIDDMWGEEFDFYIRCMGDMGDQGYGPLAIEDETHQSIGSSSDFPTQPPTSQASEMPEISNKELDLGICRMQSEKEVEGDPSQRVFEPEEEEGLG